MSLTDTHNAAGLGGWLESRNVPRQQFLSSESFQNLQFTDSTGRQQQQQQQQQQSLIPSLESVIMPPPRMMVPLVGSVVTGVIEAHTQGGLLVTVRAGKHVLRGVHHHAL